MTPKKGWTGNPHGRPRLDDSEKRKKNVGVRFTDQEYEDLKEKHRKSGIKSLGAFISKKINGYYSGEEND